MNSQNNRANGLARKAGKKDEQAKKTKAQQDATEDADWKVGSKDNSKALSEEDKRAEKDRKAAEKKALLAMDDDATAGVVKKKKVKKVKDDTPDFLMADAPKKKAGKGVSASNAGKVTAKLAAKEAAEKGEEERLAKLAKAGIVVQDEVVENMNHIMDFETDASGLDNALDLLTVSDAPKRKKPLGFKEWEEANMARIKDDYPKLKLSQYKELLFKVSWSSAGGVIASLASLYCAKKQSSYARILAGMEEIAGQPSKSGRTSLASAWHPAGTLGTVHRSQRTQARLDLRAPQSASLLQLHSGVAVVPSRARHSSLQMLQRPPHHTHTRPGRARGRIRA
jgi:hypothetical protein